MPCHTRAEIYTVQEEELGQSLERFSETFKNWDSDKCPVAKQVHKDFVLFLIQDYFRKMLKIAKTSKVIGLVDSLTNYDNYQYDYDVLDIGYISIGNFLIYIIIIN